METNHAYTHIVVGAGSAGCLLAARIAENPSFNVLLLEAGPDCEGTAYPDKIRDARRVPMKGQSEAYDKAIDWNVRVDLPDAGVLRVAQARLVGGGSSINGGTALRNHPRDCSEWVDLGNDAWRWEDVEVVYSALENDELKHTTGPHPLVRTKLAEAGKIQNAFVSGALDNGFSWVEDLNDPGAEGVGASPVCRQGNRRVSIADTFLGPARRRKNLHIVTDALVDRILFANRKATAVLLADKRCFAASEEIVVAAGALFSPALLQRSGIGPPSVLSSLDIPVMQDLPVGENLVDHCSVPVTARPKPGAYAETDFSLQMQARWSSAASPGAMDMQLVCFSYLYSAPDPQAQTQRSLGGTVSGHVAGIGCNINKPTSSGVLRITSRNPFEQPYVAPNYLATAADRACAREAVRLAHRIIKSDAMQTVLFPLHDPTGDVLASDDLLDDWIRSQYASTYHFSGTCRMASWDRDGVVDQSGRVYGLRGLRVGDASVLPTSPSANTMWSTCLFAERIGRSLRDGVPIEQASARL